MSVVTRSGRCGELGGVGAGRVTVVTYGSMQKAGRQAGKQAGQTWRTRQTHSIDARPEKYKSLGVANYSTLLLSHLLIEHSTLTQDAGTADTHGDVATTIDPLVRSGDADNQLRRRPARTSPASCSPAEGVRRAATASCDPACVFCVCDRLLQWPTCFVKQGSRLHSGSEGKAQA